MDDKVGDALMDTLPLIFVGIAAGCILMAVLCGVAAIAEAVMDYRKHNPTKDIL